MKLQLRYQDRPDGRVYMLTDETGTPLPGQRELTVRCTANEPTTITVVLGTQAGEVEVLSEAVLEPGVVQRGAYME